MAVDDGVVQPGDPAWVAVAADVTEVEHVTSGHISVFSGRAVGDDAVGTGRSEGIEEHAIESVLAGVGGAANGFAADKANAGCAGFGGEELGEEIAIDCDLADDKGLRAVEIYLGGGVEGPRFGAGAVLKGLLGKSVPFGICCDWLGLDAGADGALREVLNKVGGDAEVVVKPPRFFEQGGAGVGRGLAFGLDGIEDDQTSIFGVLGGFECGGSGRELGGAACTGAGSASV